MSPAERDQVDLARHPYVSAHVPGVGGCVHLESGSGPLEAVWVRVEDDEGLRVRLDPATGQHLAAPVRLTPSQARQLARVLLAYASTHTETAE